MIVEEQDMPRQLFESIVASSPELNLAITIDNAEIADICCVRHEIDMLLFFILTKNAGRVQM